ncbi:MAG: glycosyltransferase family 2 protein [Bariatricus sp.]|nr:glycosyltransferase family 2 protein [Bariatricus sp.]
MVNVSVVMATYNGEKYIKEQLESIYSQEVAVDEVIICDDCSSDKTVEIVNEFIHEHNLCNWKVTINEHNVGFVKNFTKAFTLVNGKYIFLCDQDDIWEKNKTKVMLMIMEKNSISVLNTSFRLIDSDGNYIKMSQKEKQSNYCLIKDRRVSENDLISFDLKNIICNNIAPGCTMCCTNQIKDLFLKIKNPVSIPHDWIINILGACLGKVYFLNIPLTRYRLHGNNTLGVVKKRTNLNLCAKDIRIQSIEDKEYNLNSRMDIAKQYDESICLLIFDKMFEFLKNRKDYIKEPSLNKLVRLVKNIRLYRVLFDIRACIGDVVYLFQTIIKKE